MKKDDGAAAHTCIHTPACTLSDQGLVVGTGNPTTRKAEAGRSRVQGFEIGLIAFNYTLTGPSKGTSELVFLL